MQNTKLQYLLVLFSLLNAVNISQSIGIEIPIPIGEIFETRQKYVYRVYNDT